MKLYADTLTRRTRQIIADVLVLLWVGAWVWVGRQIYDTIQLLQTPAESIASAGQSVNTSLNGAAEQASGVPIVGDSLKDWLSQAAGAGTKLESAGTSMSGTVSTLALTVALITALAPILSVVVVWLWIRLRFARAATSAQRFIDSNADLDLFALRAMSRQPMHAIARISDDPAGAWRRQDTVVIDALATLELRHHGLRPPKPATRKAG